MTSKYEEAGKALNEAYEEYKKDPVENRDALLRAASELKKVNMEMMIFALKRSAEDGTLRVLRDGKFVSP